MSKSKSNKKNRDKMERKILINSEDLETRMALLRDGRLEEYQVERKGERNILGSVYMGRIVNIQPSLAAVFVDIGMEKNAFMRFSDLCQTRKDYFEVDDYCDEKETSRWKGSSGLDGVGSGSSSSRDGGEVSSPRLKSEEVARRFPVGTELLVQVVKGPIGGKGSRVNAEISIPGRYLVFMPYSKHVGVSRKIEDPKERSRLRKILSELPLPENTGCICRTVGEGRKSEFFHNDLTMLLEQWRKMEKLIGRKRAPYLVSEEPSLVEKSVRDFLTEDIEEIVVDDRRDHELCVSTVGRILGVDRESRIKLYQKARPLFEYYGVEEQINAFFEREVELPGGGRICIDETEALIAIDVNSGSARGRSKSDVILETNLEACEETARQLRLRNIGGLVVIDFIDMVQHKHREKVLRTMRKLVEGDRSKTKILPISTLGLMQMTRQREYESLLERVYDPCPYCSGSGKVKSAMTMSVEIQRALKELLKRKRQDRDLALRVIMHPTVLARLKNEDSAILKDLEDRYGKDLSFRADPTLHREEYKLLDPRTGIEFDV